MNYKKLLAPVMLAAIVGLPATVTAKEAGLPRSMVWSSYEVGSSGYVESAAIADAMMRQYGTRIRVMPSGTSIGRMMPLKTDRAQYGWFGSEAYFAAEGVYEFSAPDWGPQDLRALLGRPAAVGFAAGKDAGMHSIQDMKGKRVAWVEANPSLNMKAEALLNFAGLTWNDVQQVRFPSYTAAIRGVIENTVDAAIASPNAAIVIELQTSRRGLQWVDIPPDDEEGWAQLNKVAPLFAPIRETMGADLSEAKPANLASYKYPVLSVYNDNVSEEQAYNMVKAIASTYDLYKDVNSYMPRWNITSSARTPIDMPFHAGAVRYFKEVGIWNDEDEQWNQNRLERLQNVQAAWDEARKQAETDGVDAKQWPDYWLDYRAKHL